MHRRAPLHPADQLAHCNRYLHRIGDPLITNAVLHELSDVLSLPLKTVYRFAKYGRLTGLDPNGDGSFANAPMPRRYASGGAIPIGAKFFKAASHA